MSHQAIASILLILAVLARGYTQQPVGAPKDALGPLRGSLVVAGGGALPEAAAEAFVRLAGGSKARLVVIPTAHLTADENGAAQALDFWKKRGIGSATILHTRTRDQANGAAFAKPLAEATAVWIDGGDQTRLTAAFHRTAVERALHQLLARGGVIGGTSAGAAVLSPLMIGGGAVVARLEPGFGLLPGAIIDQHFLKRNRADRLLEALFKNPGWFGLGIDEGTAVIAQGRTLTVVGDSYAVVCLSGNAHRPASCQFLKAGEKADLIALSRAALDRTRQPFPAATPPVPVVAKGTLIIGGGGAMPPEVWQRFLDLAGGPETRIVFIPTAQDDPLQPQPGELRRLKQMGATNIKVLHARDRTEANAPAFLAEIRKANAIWFTGGRQWRYVDAYLDTAAAKEFHALLERGGVIGGSSAGASIQADYMVRGDPLGNTRMMAEGYERGLGFLKGVAIDQHFTQRNRAPDMSDAMARYPQLLGIGIDEATAIVVHGSIMEVVGKNDVSVYDRRKVVKLGARDYERLGPGSRYNLKDRTRLNATERRTPREEQ